MFGHAVFGWDPFAVIWQLPTTPPPPVGGLVQMTSQLTRLGENQ